MNAETRRVYKLLQRFDRSRTRKQRAGLVKITYDYLLDSHTLLDSPVFRRTVEKKMEELRREPAHLRAVYEPSLQRVERKLQQTRKVKK